MKTQIADWYAGLGWIDVVDILLVLFLLYEGYKLVKGTGADKVFIGLFSIILLWKTVDYLELGLTATILGSIVNVGALALVIVFQPEIRRFLQFIGTNHLFGRSRKGFSVLNYFFRGSSEPKLNIEAIVEACSRMATSLTGALIIISRENKLEYPISTGERIDAVISSQLLENIFYKNSPLHDGAVIVAHNKIVAARCILPVSANPNISVSLGLRHRAAVGITEQSDALAIVVSEQTGSISFIKAGKIQRNITPEKLTELLSTRFANQSEEKTVVTR